MPKPTDGMKEEARKGLAWREEHGRAPAVGRQGVTSRTFQWGDF